MIEQVGLVSSFWGSSEDDMPSQDYLALIGNVEESQTPQHCPIPWSYVRIRKRGECILGFALDDQRNTSYILGEL